MYDIIGDIHSCFTELSSLLSLLGYNINSNGIYHPDNRRIVLVGDLFDRGPYPNQTLDMVENLISSGHFIIKGNHDDKLQRWAKGNKVKKNHGLEDTAHFFEDKKDRVFSIVSSFPYFLLLDNENLVVCHAGWRNDFKDMDPFNKRVRAYCIYGPVSKVDDDGTPHRIDWEKDRTEQKPIIVHGHRIVREVRKIGNVWNIDTGCVFGGLLTALRYPEMTLTQVKAEKIYSETLNGWE